MPLTAPLVHGSACMTPHVLMQALAFGWLGRWYEVVAQDFEKAQECYEKALTLDPKDCIAGETSCAQCRGWARSNVMLALKVWPAQDVKSRTPPFCRQSCNCLLTQLPFTVVHSAITI